MPLPCPHHCPKPRGGGVAAVLVVVVVLAAAAVARPVVHAAEDMLKVALIAVASVAGLGAIGAVAYAAMRARASHATTGQTIVRHTPAIESSAQALSTPQPLAIEAPRPDLAVLKAMAAEHGYDVVRQTREN
jgi:hypothetical protein